MPVFHKEGKTILYVHVPKTGGTSIEIFFEHNGFKTEYLDRTGGSHSLNRVRRCSPQHMHSEQLVQLFNLSNFDYVFMTVRHPLSRIKSEYRMRHHQGHAGPDLNSWIGRILHAYRERQYILDNHIRPQIEFLINGCKVFRQEDLRDRAWIEDIENALTMPLQANKLGTHMTFPADGNRSVEELDKARLDMLMEFYQRDFAEFGYDPGQQ